MCVCVCFFTIIKTKLMVRKMLAMATTVWSAEMARVKDVAVYDTRMMENKKMKNASTDAFSPAEKTQTHQTKRLISYEHEWRDEGDVCLTDHKVRQAAEDDGRDGAQSQDLRQDLRQEVHRHSVVSADVLVPEDTPTIKHQSINQSNNQSNNPKDNCIENISSQILILI